MSSKLKITIGALEPDLSKQLSGFISKNDGEMLDLDSHAITRCHLRGLVGDAEIERARQRLLKKVHQAVTRHGAASAPSLSK